MFTELPRYIGFPNQVYCEKRFAFDSLVKTFNGKAPIMVSTYQFKDRVTPIIDNMVFDIDSYFGLRIPYKNVENIKKFCCNNDIPYLINLSGGKGFHFFIIIKDIIPKNEVEKQITKNKLYSCQEAIVKQCNVEAIDYPTMGRLHFLIRYPTSSYVRMEDGEVTNNGFYCRNISPEDFDKGLKHISIIAKEPGTIPEKPKATKSLDDIIKLLPEYKEKHIVDGDTVTIARTGMIIPTLEAVGLPCLKEISKNTHPKHRERIELVSFLKFMGYSDIAISAYIKNLKWLDFKYAITSYQVSTIKPRYPDCKYLRMTYEKVCEKCSLRRKKC
jgi:hypothetical protein